MKKLINIAFVAAIAAGAGTLTGCSDFLDAENKTNINSDEYFQTEEGIEGLRTYTYSLLKPLVSSVDLYERGTDLYAGVHGENLGELSMYTFTPQSGTISDYYTNAYSFINNANYMVEMAGDNGTVAAEGKFLRCYGYYLLTQQFGAVPYVTWFNETPERNYPRTPLSELYPALISELEGIMNDANLPAEPQAADGYGRVSQRAVKALEQVGLGDKWRHRPMELSGGQQQRVSIARALVGRPSVILADEPTGALDSRTGREVLGMLQDIHRQGNTVVLITHDNSIAVQAQRIIRLEDGRVVYDGPADAPEAVVLPRRTGEEAAS